MGDYTLVGTPHYPRAPGGYVNPAIVTTTRASAGLPATAQWLAGTEAVGSTRLGSTGQLVRIPNDVYGQYAVDDAGNVLIYNSTYQLVPAPLADQPMLQANNVYEQSHPNPQLVQQLQGNQLASSEADANNPNSAHFGLNWTNANGSLSQFDASVPVSVAYWIMQGQTLAGAQQLAQLGAQKLGSTVVPLPSNVATTDPLYAKLLALGLEPTPASTAAVSKTVSVATAAASVSAPSSSAPTSSAPSSSTSPAGPPAYVDTIPAQGLPAAQAYTVAAPADTGIPAAPPPTPGTAPAPSSRMQGLLTIVENHPVATAATGLGVLVLLGWMLSGRR